MNIALGITGCIAAYKAVDLIRHFQKMGHEVEVVATRHALKFVTPLTLETISRHPVITRMFGRSGAWEVEHIALARRIEVLCVAPATANALAKFARGIADDFLSTLYLSNANPVVIAPAMNTAMWTHPATQENVAILKDRGAVIVEPESGWLACGEQGGGRLAPLEQIVEAVMAAVTPKTLQGKSVLVTAGPTAEDIDPVRFITNRSTGRMGYTIAREASRRGARVIFVSGPSAEAMDFPCELEKVRSAEEMARAVEARLGECHVAIMAAAVADFTPASVSSAKIKKGEAGLTLELRRTRDILAGAGKSRRPGQVLVGFAAETDEVLANARSKLAAKGADMFVANRVGPDAGFGDIVSAASLLFRDGRETHLPEQSKEGIARALLNSVEDILKSAGC